MTIPEPDQKEINPLESRLTMSIARMMIRGANAQVQEWNWPGWSMQLVFLDLDDVIDKLYSVGDQ